MDIISFPNINHIIININNAVIKKLFIKIIVKNKNKLLYIIKNLNK